MGTISLLVNAEHCGVSLNVSMHIVDVVVRMRLGLARLGARQDATDDRYRDGVSKQACREQKTLGGLRNGGGTISLLSPSLPTDPI